MPLLHPMKVSAWDSGTAKIGVMYKYFCLYTAPILLSALSNICQFHGIYVIFLFMLPVFILRNQTMR